MHHDVTVAITIRRCGDAAASSTSVVVSPRLFAQELLETTPESRDQELPFHGIVQHDHLEMVATEYAGTKGKTLKIENTMVYTEKWVYTMIYTTKL
jgi:hypothetical protein